MRQNQLHPHQTEYSPEKHVFAGCTPINRQPLTRVIPRANTERNLHEPAGEIFERAANHRARAENQHPIRPPQVVEQHRQNHRAKTVDRRERPPQKTGAILPFAEQHIVVQRLHHQTKHATDHKQPEQVEEIQRNVALASQITACHTLRNSRLILAARIQTTKREPQTSFLAQRRISRDMQRNQYEQLHGRTDQIHAQTLQRQRQ